MATVGTFKLVNKYEREASKSKFHITDNAILLLCHCMKLHFIRFFISKLQYLTLQSLSPGLVNTEMVPEIRLKENPYLNPEDIADAVLYVLGTPQHVQVRRISARQP
jgi:hypothetical protein